MQSTELKMVYKTQPLEKQAEAFNRSKDRVEYAYFMEMGTGKTKVLIDDFTWLYLQGKIDAVVVVAPKGCYLNIQKNEFPKHLHYDVPAASLAWKAPSSHSGEDKVKYKAFKDIPCEKLTVEANTDSKYVIGRNYRRLGLKILLVNVESISSDTSMDYLKDFIAKHKTLIAVDESTTLRNVSSTRTKNARILGKLAKYRRIMTGTPIANRPLDIYGQCQFLNPALLGFPSYHIFKHYFADIKMIPMGPRRSYPKIMGYRRLDELTALLDKFSYRVLKKDCLDLPDKVYTTRYVEPTTEQKKLYNQMAKLMVAEHSNGEFSTSQIVLTKIMRLQSILCGHLKMDNGETQTIESNRVASLMELLEETNGKVIIWCLYREDVRQICGNLDIHDFVEYHGGVDVADREEGLKRFKTDPNCRYFIGTQRTGGVGLTLTEATTVIYFSQGYDLEMRLQSEDRAHRIGQKQTVTYVDMVVKDSVDEKIVDCLKSKQNLADLVLSGLSEGKGFGERL